MSPRKASETTTAAKKAPAKKAAPAEAEAPVVKKAPAKKPAAKKQAEVIVQSPMGGELSVNEILAKIGAADKVYVRVDQNKAYWVRGEETGDVDLW